MRLLVLAAELPIRAYRRFVSPWKPPMCRFHPTCSAYALEALERHGLVRGTGLALWRILRCQPFCRGGHDPVPPPPQARHRGPESPSHAGDAHRP